MKKLVVALLVLGASVAWGAGRLCPTEYGACFIELEEGNFAALFQSQDFDGDGDVDYIAIFSDGFNDFNVILPNGRTYVHTNDQRAALIYCPFSLFDDEGNIVFPDERCAYGDGHASVSVWVPGTCPASIKIEGAGERMTDQQWFQFSGRLLRTGRGDCDFVAYEIVDTMP